MATYVALLRAINVAGHNMVAMADLRTLLTGLGFADVRSLLQSGNLTFRGDSRPGRSLERLLETEARKRLGLDTEFLVRTAAEWKTLVARNPFPKQAERDPARLLVMFLKTAPAAGAVAALRSVIPGRERVESDGRHAYIVYPDGIGRSRLTGNLVEKRLGVRATGRNWNTVLRLAAAVRETSAQDT